MTAAVAGFDDPRVRWRAMRRWVGASLMIGLACVSAGIPTPTSPGARPDLPKVPDLVVAVPTPPESTVEPAAIEPQLVGEPPPWLEDPELLDRILAVQPIVAAAADAHGVEPALINGLIYVESKFEAKAKGGKAMGLMQLMPGTAAAMAKDLGRKRDSYDPDFNIHAGARLVRRLLDRFDGDVDLAVAAYNRGSGTVSGWVSAGEPMPERTRNYVDRVVRARGWFRAVSPVRADP